MCVCVCVCIFTLVSMSIFLYHWCSATGFWYVLLQFSVCPSCFFFFYVLGCIGLKFSSSMENLWELKKTYFCLHLCFPFLTPITCVWRLNIFPQANKTAFFFFPLNFFLSVLSCGHVVSITMSSWLLIFYCCDM